MNKIEQMVVAHYPPYCSKWNPIEHRAFSFINRQKSEWEIYAKNACNF
jgi:hypothetical protein